MSSSPFVNSRLSNAMTQLIYTATDAVTSDVDVDVKMLSVDVEHSLQGVPHHVGLVRALIGAETNTLCAALEARCSRCLSQTC